MRQFFTIAELESMKDGIFFADIESYPNYFLAAFKCYHTGRIAYFEAVGIDQVPHEWLYFMLSCFCIVGFNFLKYDLPILSLAVTGKYSVADLKDITNQIIVERVQIHELMKQHKINLFQANVVDLIEVAPLRGSLKLYAARLHCGHIQDLPYDPAMSLSIAEIDMVRSYCFNDLDNTALLATELDKHLTLRAKLSIEFHRDLRSLSDAQLAQEIINTEIERISGSYPKRPGFAHLVGTSFRYVAPAYVNFVNPDLVSLLDQIEQSDFIIDDTGHAKPPKSIEGRKVKINNKVYTIGLGGLHSTEVEQALRQSDMPTVRILDRDVASYYPSLILKNNFAPSHLGAAFMQAFQNIVTKRLTAKENGDTSTADILKIATNGTFGKTSDPYSTIYSPSMMAQTTLTGQLSLLMLIEWLNYGEFEVVSANTDGIVVLCPQSRYADYVGICSAWEQRTKLATEETEYSAIYSKDVNNYIAIKMDGKHKVKGIYSEVGSAHNSVLSKNPTSFVVMDAVIAHLTKQVPIEQTIRGCIDIKRFVVVRAAKGGAQKDGRYLGKIVRWYYATKVYGPIVDCVRDAKVSLSDGGKPLMTLPDALPSDIDYDRYIKLAVETLENVGAQQRRNQQLDLFKDVDKRS